MHNLIKIKSTLQYKKAEFALTYCTMEIFLKDRKDVVALNLLYYGDIFEWTE